MGLASVWNRKAATSPGFQRYSDALKSKNIVWDEATLERWLANPEAFVPGTSMTFAGLKEEKDRRDVVAYLQALAENKAPMAQSKGGTGMGMQARKPDLHKAPPEAQVKAVRGRRPARRPARRGERRARRQGLRAELRRLSRREARGPAEVAEPAAERQTAGTAARRQRPHMASRR